MKCAVIGGSGLIGSRVVRNLSASGHEAVSHPQSTGIDVISAETVGRHRADLLQGLGLRDGLELTRYAIRAGLIEP